MASTQAAFDAITKQATAPVEAPTMHTPPGGPGAQAVAIKGYGQGNMLLALIGAVLGAAAGGVAWVALATVTGWQASLFAIVLGGLVGFGVAQGNGGRGGFAPGLLAGLFALVGVVGTQIAITHFAMENSLTNSGRITAADALEDLMWTVRDEFAATGQTMTETAIDDFPVEVVAEADRRWEAMSAAQRSEYVASMRRDLESVMAESSLMAFGIAYLWTNGWFGLLCAGFSATTAFTIASRDAMEVAKARAAAPKRAQGAQPVEASSLGETGFRALPTAVTPTAAGSPMKVAAESSPVKRAMGAAPTEPDPMTEKIVAEPADAGAAAPIESAPMPVGMLAKARPAEPKKEGAPKREAA